MCTTPLVKEVDGKYVSEQAQGTSRETVSGGGDVSSAPALDKTAQQASTTVVCSPPAVVPSAPVITLQININCNAAEVLDLAGSIEEVDAGVAVHRPRCTNQRATGRISMARPFAHSTAELVVQVVDAVQASSKTRAEFVEAFCGLSQTQAETGT